MSRNVQSRTYSRAMHLSRTADIQGLAVEVARRHGAVAPSIPGRWDLLARLRQRRYERRLVEVPLQQLREAIARAEHAGHSRPVGRT